MPMYRPEGSERFLKLASALGALDIRCTDSRCIFLVVAPTADEERVDAIRILARMEWPDRHIVVGKRSSPFELPEERERDSFVDGSAS